MGSMCLAVQKMESLQMAFFWNLFPSYPHFFHKCKELHLRKRFLHYLG